MARQNVVAVATSNDAEKQVTATGGLTGILGLNLFFKWASEGEFGSKSSSEIPTISKLKTVYEDIS